MPYDEGFLVCTGGRRAAEDRSEAGQQARVDFALYGTVDPDEGPQAHRRDGGGGRRGLQVLDLLHRSEALSAHPAADPACMLRGDCRRPASTAGVHNENDEMVRAAIEGRRGVRHHATTARTACRAPPLTETLAMAEVYEIARRHRLLRAMSFIARSDAATICARPIARRASTPRSRLHPLSHARRGARRRAAGRQGQDQSADPPARARSRRSGIISPPAISRWSRPTTSAGRKTARPIPTC